MKNLFAKCLFAILLCVQFSAVQAQIAPAIPVFDSASGKMKLPNLLFEGKVYYLEMNVADVAQLSLQIDAASLVDVTPDGSLSGNLASNIVGSWNVEGESTEFTFNDDGTWSMSQDAGVDEESCPNGGIESGIFRYTASTGVFFPSIFVDENGECGLSNTRGLLRIYPDGNTLTVEISGEEGAVLVRSE